MAGRILVATLVCLALAACEPRGTPQKPKTTAHAAVIQPSGLQPSGFRSMTQPGTQLIGLPDESKEK